MMSHEWFRNDERKDREQHTEEPIKEQPAAQKEAAKPKRRKKAEPKVNTAIQPEPELPKDNGKDDEIKKKLAKLAKDYENVNKKTA